MNYQPGDVVFAHTNGIFGKAIRWGEHLRFRKSSWTNHMAYVWKIELGKAYVIQAEPKGVTSDKTIDSLGNVRVFRPAGLDVQKSTKFGLAQVGKRYGWWSIVSCSFDLATWDWVPSIRQKGTWICSALVEEMLRAGGVFDPVMNWGDIYVTTPAQGLDVAHRLGWVEILP